jgi:hypothetical protein
MLASIRERIAAAVLSDTAELATRTSAHATSRTIVASKPSIRHAHRSIAFCEARFG